VFQSFVVPALALVFTLRLLVPSAVRAVAGVPSLPSGFKIAVDATATTDLQRRRDELFSLDVDSAVAPTRHVRRHHAPVRYTIVFKPQTDAGELAGRRRDAKRGPPTRDPGPGPERTPTTPTAPNPPPARTPTAPGAQLGPAVAFGLLPCRASAFASCRPIRAGSSRYPPAHDQQPGRLTSAGFPFARKARRTHRQGQGLKARGLRLPRSPASSSPRTLGADIYRIDANGFPRDRRRRHDRRVFPCDPEPRAQSRRHARDEAAEPTPLAVGSPVPSSTAGLSITPASLPRPTGSVTYTPRQC